MADMEQNYDFLATLESVDMPEHIKAAIVEAFTFTHDVDRTPMSQDEINKRLDMMERGNKINGLPFDRNAIEQDMKARPWKYKSKPLLDRPLNLNRMMHNVNLSNPNAKKCREKFYSAAIDAVARLYRENNVKFNAEAYLRYVNEHDSDSWHGNFDHSLASGNVRFSTFDEANKNPTVFQLKRENQALYDVMKQAYIFSMGLAKAKETNSAEMYAAVYNQKHGNDMPKLKERPKAELTGEDLEEFNRKEAELAAEKNAPSRPQPVAARVACIGELRDVFNKLPYYRLYERFSRNANKQQLAITPKPDEKFSDFMARVSPGDIPLNKFLSNLKKDVSVAYSVSSFDDLLAKLRHDLPMFDDFYRMGGVKERTQKKVDAGELMDTNAVIYSIWKVIHDISDYKASRNY